MDVSAKAPIFLPPTYDKRDVLMARALVGSYDWGDKALQVPRLHDMGIKGAGFTVGIVDTGQSRHPDLVYKSGWSVVDAGPNAGYDRAGHGSHVASIIRRAAPLCELVSVKALGDDGSGDTAGIAKAIRWCLKQNCHVINLSLGGGDDPDVRRSIAEANEAGVLVICAAGNSGGAMDYPALLNSVAAVGSSNAAGEISKYSSRGPEVDAAAPGEDILGCGTERGYVRMSGTSMACPLFSAMVVLRLDYQKQAVAAGHRVARAVVDQDSLLAHIEKHSTDQGDRGRDTSWGWGIPTISFVLGGIEEIAPEPPAEALPDFNVGPFGVYLKPGEFKAVWPT